MAKDTARGQKSNDVGPLTLGRAGTAETTTRRVRLTGATPVMFDRYPGDNDTRLEVWQRLYFVPGTKALALPAENLMSFLSAQNTDSAPKKLLDSRKYKKTAQACASYVAISAPPGGEAGADTPEGQLNPALPFTRDGSPVVFGKMDSRGRDPDSGVWTHHSVARLDKGIPNPKVRPVLPLPWDLEFSLTLYKNKEIQEQQLLWLFTQGGLAVGLGTFRPRYGKFWVSLWE